MPHKFTSTKFLLFLSGYLVKLSGISFGVNLMSIVDMAPGEELDLYIRYKSEPGIRILSRTNLISGKIPPVNGDCVDKSSGMYDVITLGRIFS